MKITIPGKPVAKKRPRFYRRGKFVGTYNDQKTEEGKWLLSARSQITEKMKGPIYIECRYYLPRPKSHYGTGKNSEELKPSAPEFPITRPDIDNYNKFVFDCLNGEAWKDDSQIIQVSAYKVYGDNPRTEIFIEEL